MCSKTVNGFKVLPIRFSASSTSGHELFLKEHSDRNPDKSTPAGRTLLILNVPPYVDEKIIKQLFVVAGKVSSVKFENNLTSKDHTPNSGFKNSYVVFKTREDLLKALKLNTLKPISTDKNPVKIGLYKWIENYNSSICDPKELAAESNRFMERFDRVELNKKNKKEEVDDEGWTVVTNKGRNPGISRKESVENHLNDKINSASKKGLKNFYSFQRREGKIKQLANLRKDFHETKKKINSMKSARRFKPY